jgi:hypothetical protein
MGTCCVPVGCARLAPATPPPAAGAADASFHDVLKLAKALLAGCASRKEEVRVSMDGATIAICPQYISCPHRAVMKQGGEAAFWAEARKLAHAFGVVPANQSELALWGYAAFRIPSYGESSLPPGAEPDEAEYSRA